MQCDMIQTIYLYACCQIRHAQYLGDLACDYVVLKNDEKTVDEIKAMNPRGVLVSPGPGMSAHGMLTAL